MLADTMEVFDGTSINAQGNYFGDSTLYFVLNQGQRQAPRGWEVGLLGMCIGEERRLTIPPSLGYGKAGVPKGKIVPKLPVPPNARLIYDIKLVGINGLNTPSDDASALGERIPYDYQVQRACVACVFVCSRLALLAPCLVPSLARVRDVVGAVQDCKKIGGLGSTTRAFECGPDVQGRRL
jgi:hypothetical protein